MKLKQWLFLLLLLIPSICYSAAVDYKVDNLGNIYGYSLYIGNTLNSIASGSLFKSGITISDLAPRTADTTLNVSRLNPDTTTDGLLSMGFEAIVKSPTTSKQALIALSTGLYNYGNTGAVYGSGFGIGIWNHSEAHGTGTTWSIATEVYDSVGNADIIGHEIIVGRTASSVKASRGLQLIADGNQPLEKALTIEQMDDPPATATWAKGLYAEQSAIGTGASDSFIELKDQFRVKRDGDVIAKGPVADVRAYGAYNDGTNTTTTTTAIQTAIDSGAKAIYLPDGIYSFTALNITGKNGFRFYGNGKTELRWAGADNVPMLLIKNSEKVMVEKLWFNNTTPNHPSSCIESNITAATLPPEVNGVTGNIFRDLTLGGIGENSIKRGIHYTYTGSDQNNDQGTFDTIEVRNYSIAAFDNSNHTQSVVHNFFNCRFIGSGPVGIKSDNVGGFNWYGGVMLNHTTADVILASYLWPVSINGLISEGSVRFVTGNVPIPVPLSIKSCRWTDTNLHADGYMMTLQGGGPYILEGNNFGAGITTDIIPKIHITTGGSGERVSLIAKGNFWYQNQSATYPPSPFVLTGDNILLVSEGNLMGYSDGTSRPIIAGMHISKHDGAKELSIGDDIWELNDSTVRLTMGNTTNNVVFRQGQSATAFGYMQWVYNATEDNSYLNFQSYPITNKGIIFQQGGGNIGFGFNTPLSKVAIDGGLHVGGASDAGDNNLLVDGTAIFTGGFGANTSMGGYKITSLGTPTDATDGATKGYVDALGSGLHVKYQVRLATAAVLPNCTAAGHEVNKTLTADAVGVLTVDGVATVLNDRILVKTQATGADKGIYKVTTEGTAGVAFVLTRATDADTDAEVLTGMYCFVTAGTANTGTGWVVTTLPTIELDVTSLSFALFSSSTSFGTGVAGQVAYWSGTQTITGDTDMTFSGTRLTVTDLTVTNGPIISSLTASRPVYTDGSKGLISGTLPKTITFTMPGTLVTGANATPSIIITRSCTISKAYAYTRTAPTGATIIFDINLNGSTIWSNQANRLTLAVGANTGTQTSFNTTALVENDRLDLDVDQTGSTIPGANITVEIEMGCI